MCVCARQRSKRGGRASRDVRSAPAEARELEIADFRIFRSHYIKNDFHFGTGGGLAPPTRRLPRQGAVLGARRARGLGSAGSDRRTRTYQGPSLIGRGRPRAERIQPIRVRLSESAYPSPHPSRGRFTLAKAI